MSIKKNDLNIPCRQCKYNFKKEKSGKKPEKIGIRSLDSPVSSGQEKRSSPLCGRAGKDRDHGRQRGLAAGRNGILRRCPHRPEADRMLRDRCAEDQLTVPALSEKSTKKHTGCFTSVRTSCQMSDFSGQCLAASECAAARSSISRIPSAAFFLLSASSGGNPSGIPGGPGSK